MLTRGAGRPVRGAAVGAAAALIAWPLASCSPDTAPQDAPPASAPLGSPAASSLPQGGEPVELDPAHFTLEITNPYWPMAVGDRWVYDESDGEGGTQLVEVDVLDQTRTVASGVEVRVVHDRVSADGETVEDTYDYYAQDRDGNLWYFGEDTKEYEGGAVVSTAGSWEAGVDGAQPGIMIPANPLPGMEYREEYLGGQAEDQAAVLSITEQLDTPTGSYSDVLKTRNTTPLEPDISEEKYYAPGIGQVQTVQTSGGASAETLIESTRVPG